MKLRVNGLFSAKVLTLLSGFILMFSPPPVLAFKGVEQTTKDTEDRLMANETTSLGDLAGHYRNDQYHYRTLMPPCGTFYLKQSGGMLVFDPKSFPDTFNTGLIGDLINGCPVYSILISEDPITREVVIANAEGKEIASVKPESGYDPWWFLNRQYPDLYSGIYSADMIAMFRAACDPAHIQITLTLLPEGFVKDYAKGVALEKAMQAEALAAEELKNPKPKKGSLLMTRYQSSGMTNIDLVNIENTTNGMMVTVAYPDYFTNRIDIYTTTDLVGGWWDLALSSTNKNSSTNFIQWVDVNAMAQQVRIYNTGKADLDTDGDGIPDARETLMYHTCPTNWDSDGDGLSDSNEVFCLHTDPNNGDTNKPNVWISYPAQGSVEVWEP